MFAARARAATPFQDLDAGYNRRGYFLGRGPGPFSQGRMVRKPEAEVVRVEGDDGLRGG
jgi:hypothetical protein